MKTKLYSQTCKKKVEIQPQNTTQTSENWNKWPVFIPHPHHHWTVSHSPQGPRSTDQCTVQEEVKNVESKPRAHSLRFYINQTFFFFLKCCFSKKDNCSNPPYFHSHTQWTGSDAQAFRGFWLCICVWLSGCKTGGSKVQEQQKKENYADLDSHHSRQLNAICTFEV